MRTGSAHVMERTYVVDLRSIVLVYRGVCNTAEAGKEPFRKRVERVTGYYLPDLSLARGRMEAEKVFHSNKIRGLHVLSKNPVPYSSFVGNRQSFPEGVLFHLFK